MTTANLRVNYVNLQEADSADMRSLNKVVGYFFIKQASKHAVVSESEQPSEFIMQVSRIVFIRETTTSVNHAAESHSRQTLKTIRCSSPYNPCDIMAQKAGVIT